MYVAKTEVLISCAVPVQLICAFVFAYVKSRFSRNTAHLMSVYIYYRCSYKICLVEAIQTNTHNISYSKIK